MRRIMLLPWFSLHGTRRVLKICMKYVNLSCAMETALRPLVYCVLKTGKVQKLTRIHTNGGNC